MLTYPPLKYKKRTLPCPLLGVQINFRAFSGFLYWIKKFSSPKIEYKLVAERSEANQNSLTFPFWCPHSESNRDLRIKSPLLYLLSYGGPGLWRAADFVPFPARRHINNSYFIKDGIYYNPSRKNNQKADNNRGYYSFGLIYGIRLCAGKKQ